MTGHNASFGRPAKAYVKPSLWYSTSGNLCIFILCFLRVQIKTHYGPVMLACLPSSTTKSFWCKFGGMLPRTGAPQFWFYPKIPFPLAWFILSLRGSIRAFACLLSEHILLVRLHVVAPNRKNFNKNKRREPRVQVYHALLRIYSENRKWPTRITFWITASFYGSTKHFYQQDVGQWVKIRRQRRQE